MGPAAATAAGAGLRRACLLLLLVLLCVLAPSTTRATGDTQQHQRLQQPYQPQLLHYGSSVAPILTNYSFASSHDTFQVCREQSGVPDGHDVSNEDLLQQFRLPKDLNKHKHLNLPQLVELLHSVQPAFKVVFQPMLSGEADIRRLVDPDTPTNAAHSLPKLVHFTVKDKNRLRPHQVGAGRPAYPAQKHRGRQSAWRAFFKKCGVPSP